MAAVLVAAAAAETGSESPHRHGQGRWYFELSDRISPFRMLNPQLFSGVVRLAMAVRPATKHTIAARFQSLPSRRAD